jgi:short-subunit dehydrogenase
MGVMAEVARVMVVTGSAAGIGRELALQAAQNGNRVVVNSRRREHLDPIAASLDEIGASYLAVEADLRTAEGRRRTVPAGSVPICIGEFPVSAARDC